MFSPYAISKYTTRCFKLCHFRSALLASIVALDQGNPIETLQQLLDYDIPLALPAGTRLTPMFRDSPREDMRTCYQKCVLDKGTLFQG